MENSVINQNFNANGHFHWKKKVGEGDILGGRSVCFIVKIE